MNEQHVCKNIYQPAIAVLDEVREEIKEVKTFFFHFEDPAAEKIFRNFMPGQFAMVSIFGVGEIAISLPPSPTEDKLFFTTRQVGSATAAMHKLKAGDTFAVRGPYGNGFPMNDYEGRNLIIVAGGIGLIPLCASQQEKIRKNTGFLRRTYA
jgi:NAD(P)H-flavin reductase